MLQSAEKGQYGTVLSNENTLWTAAILDAKKSFSPLSSFSTSAQQWQVSYRVVADMVRRLVEDKNITTPVAHLVHTRMHSRIEAGFHFHRV